MKNPYGHSSRFQCMRLVMCSFYIMRLWFCITAFISYESYRLSEGMLSYYQFHMYCITILIQRCIALCTAAFLLREVLPLKTGQVSFSGFSVLKRCTAWERYDSSKDCAVRGILNIIFTDLFALENINISCVEQHAIESNTTYEFTNTGWKVLQTDFTSCFRFKRSKTTNL